MGKKLDKKKILSILAVVLIILIVLFIVWEDLRINMKIMLGDEIAQFKKHCKLQCKSEDKIKYCCLLNKVGRNSYDCQNEILKTSCELDCSGFCEVYCQQITDPMTCAFSGCSWIVKAQACSSRT